MSVSERTQAFVAWGRVFGLNCARKCAWELGGEHVCVLGMCLGRWVSCVCGGLAAIFAAFLGPPKKPCWFFFVCARPAQNMRRKGASAFVIEFGEGGTYSVCIYRENSAMCWVLG